MKYVNNICISNLGNPKSDFPTLDQKASPNT